MAIENVQQFAAEREAAVKQIAALIPEAQAKLKDITDLADKYGIEVDMELGERYHTYYPFKPDGVTDEDVKKLHQEVQTDWAESDYYGEYAGWSNSSSYC